MYNYIIPQKKQEEICYEEYDAKKVTLITINNSCGNVSIKTDPSSDKVFLKAIKKSPEKEALSDLTFAQKQNGPEMRIESMLDKNNDAQIDFELIIPLKCAVNATLGNGFLLLKDVHARAQLKTQKGDITIINAHSTVHAQVETKGAITFVNPFDRIQVETHAGNIIIHDAQDSVIANTHYGSIQLFAKEVPSTSVIKLTTHSGAIQLHLPPDVNADLQASTKYGTITSDHFITLKPQTTQLNKYAWKRFQKQIDGVLGSGEAQIKLSSVRSDIKVLEKKMT